MAGGGLAGAAQFSWSGAERDAARPLDDLPHPTADRRGNPSGGVPLGAATLGGKGPAEGEDGGHRCHDLGGERGLRSIVRRKTGEDYQEFLRRLAQESGIATPTREQLAKLDRKRAHKGSNEDWDNPHDPEAGITKLKDGRTHLAYKAQHAVDLETRAVVAVTVATG